MADLPRFSLAYTSARPLQIASVVTSWMQSACRASAVEVIVCVDAPDAEAAGRTLVSVSSDVAVRLVVNTGPRTCVAGWNEAAKAATGDVILAISDDFFPPQSWDELLTQIAPHGWWQKDHVVAVNDDNVRDVFTLPILTRTRWERYGYLLHPAYESLFSDTEFTAVAYADGVVLDGRSLVFEHRHHDLGKRRKDEVDSRHSSRERWERGEALFLARQRAGFPRGTAALPAGDRVQGELVFAMYVQATKDDFCLAETIRALLAQSKTGDARIGAVFLFSPDEYWSGRPTPAEELAEVRAVADELRATGVAMHCVAQPIAPFRVGAPSRIEVETRARNAALAEIRRQGFAHILVVDGDEWWRPGALSALAAVVRARQPAAVVSRLVPVVGLPGYPVLGAKQWATIYVGPNAPFVWCRIVVGVREKLKGDHILHFTATRRTMEEIVRKHRESGHYDDPDYDFEGWIANVLPNLRPGAKNAHMYRREQIWPRVRRWQRDELAQLPVSLRSFLGTETEPRWRSWCRRIGLAR